MGTQFSNVRWGRVLLAGALVFIANFMSVFLVVSVYAVILGFEARGAPDQALIDQFASQISTWFGPVLTALLTLGAAVWVARKVEAAIILHGVLVGLIAVLIGLTVTLVFFDSSIDMPDIVRFVLAVAAGWVGGFLGSRGR